jgi:hypothetical protein
LIDGVAAESSQAMAAEDAEDQLLLETLSQRLDYSGPLIPLVMAVATYVGYARFGYAVGQQTGCKWTRMVPRHTTFCTTSTPEGFIRHRFW